MTRSGILVFTLAALCACKSTVTPMATPAPTAAPVKGPLTDAELDAVAAALSCHDVRRADRIVRMTCGDEARNVSLVNLDRQLESAASGPERLRMAQAFLSFGKQVASEAAAEQTDVAPLESLIPVIKSRAALQAAIDRFPPEAKGKVTIPFRPLAGDVVVALGIDRPATTETVTNQHLARWHVDAGAIAARAVQNLASRPFPSPMDASDEGGPRLFLINSGDSYDAARILVPEARIRLAEALGGAAVFAIPDRDHLLAARLDDDAAVASLRKRAAKLFHEGSYAITDELLRYDDGKFAVVP